MRKWNQAKNDLLCDADPCVMILVIITFFTHVYNSVF